ncbi:MAG: glycosyltransferase [Candidatus Binatia bacterium]
MSKVSVCAIVLDYFGAEKTTKCLTSLVNQGLTTVYILDNSASTAAAAQLRKAIEELVTTDYKTQILSAGKNLGFGRGINFVLAHDIHSESPHDYYLLLNNDAVAGPGLVSGLLSALKKEPQAVLAAPRVVSSQPGREYGIWYHRYLGLLLSQPGQFRFHYFTGCCLLIPRHLVGEARLFDEAFFMYGEDAELGWRLTNEEKKMVCAKKVYVEHEYGPSVDRSSFFYEYHMARGHLLLSWKTWMHPVEIPFLLLFKLIGLGSRATARCCRYRSLAPLCSLFVAWLPLRVDKT